MSNICIELKKKDLFGGFRIEETVTNDHATNLKEREVNRNGIEIETTVLLLRECFALFRF